MFYDVFGNLKIVEHFSADQGPHSGQRGWRDAHQDGIFAEGNGGNGDQSPQGDGSHDPPKGGVVPVGDSDVPSNSKMVDAIGNAGLGAFEDAIAVGAPPKKTFSAIISASGEAAAKMGVNTKVISKVQEAGKNAFNKEIDNGGTFDNGMIAANNAIDNVTNEDDNPDRTNSFKVDEPHSSEQENYFGSEQLYEPGMI